MTEPKKRAARKCRIRRRAGMPPAPGPEIVLGEHDKEFVREPAKEREADDEEKVAFGDKVGRKQTGALCRIGRRIRRDLLFCHLALTAGAARGRLEGG